MSFRDEKLTSRLVHLAGEYIAREAGRETLITPTRASISSDRKNTTIYVSVFPDDQSEHALRFLTRHKDLFRDYLRKTGRMWILPYIHFEIDYGEKNRQHIDELSREIRDSAGE